MLGSPRNVAKPCVAPLTTLRVSGTPYISRSTDGVTNSGDKGTRLLVVLPPDSSFGVIMKVGTRVRVQGDEVQGMDGGAASQENKGHGLSQ